jgi:hypothetical protein
MSMFSAKTFTDESDRAVQEFFNSIYDQEHFLWALKLVVDKRGARLTRITAFFRMRESRSPGPTSKGSCLDATSAAKQ